MATQLGGASRSANSSIMDWLLPGLGYGLDALSGILGGDSQNKLTREQMAEQARQFNEQLKNSRGGAALGVQQQLDQAPIRDRLQYNIMQRLGAPVQPFVGRDMFNPSAQAPQQGGIDMNAMNTALAGYKPGAGGVNTDTASKFLGVLGYGPNASTQPGFLSPQDDAAQAKRQQDIERLKRVAGRPQGMNNPNPTLTNADLARQQALYQQYRNQSRPGGGY